MNKDMNEQPHLSLSGSSNDKETSMSRVKIVSRWDRTKVLYAAKGAANVKEAVEAALKQGAYLRGAYLRGADLRGADLRGADLQNAYLQDAYLQDACLQGAYLRGACLQGAYLRGACLQGANLRGAYLQGAYLRGAYLRGANLQNANLRDELWGEVADVLQRALSEISITGHWIKGSLSKQLESGEQAYCASGAVQHAGEGTALVVASWLLASVAGGSVETFNDAKVTTLEDVQMAFRLAIRHAQRWGGTVALNPTTLVEQTGSSRGESVCCQWPDECTCLAALLEAER